MEHVKALGVTCKQLSVLTRDDQYTKMQKQKRAAHANTYRLRKKLREIEISNKLLTIMWINTNRHNSELQTQIEFYAALAKDIEKENE